MYAILVQQAASRKNYGEACNLDGSKEGNARHLLRTQPRVCTVAAPSWSFNFFGFPAPGRREGGGLAGGIKIETEAAILDIASCANGAAPRSVICSVIMLRSNSHEYSHAASACGYASLQRDKDIYEKGN
jgi:hypothetical protein